MSDIRTRCGSGGPVIEEAGKEGCETSHCAVVGCDRRLHARGLCDMHHARRARGSSIGPPHSYNHRDLAERLALNSDTEGDCWVWMGTPNNMGYGRISFLGDRGQFEVEYAHRVSYSVFVGPVPAGAVVRHVCDNPPCINPLHLVLGTQRDNIRDMARRRRHPRHLPPAVAQEIYRRSEAGHGYRQIADALGLPRGTVSARISKFRRSA